MAKVVKFYDKAAFRAEYKRLFLESLSSHKKFNACVVKRYTETFKKKYPNVDFCATLFSENPSLLLDEDKSRYQNFFGDTTSIDERDARLSAESRYILDVVHYFVLTELQEQTAVHTLPRYETILSRATPEELKAIRAKKAAEKPSDKIAREAKEQIELAQATDVRNQFFEAWGINKPKDAGLGIEDTLYLKALADEAKDVLRDIVVPEGENVQLFFHQNKSIHTNYGFLDAWNQNKPSRLKSLLKVTSIMTFLSAATMTGVILGAGVVPALTFAGFGATLGALAGPVGMAIGALVGAAIGFSIAAAVIGVSLAITSLARKRKPSGYQPIPQDIESDGSMRSLAKLSGPADKRDTNVKPEGKTYSWGNFFLRIVRLETTKSNTPEHK